jgi:hypothetical protein
MAPTTWAIQAGDGAGNWATRKPVFTCSPDSALRRLRMVAGALRSFPLRVVNAETHQVLGVRLPLPGPDELQPNHPVPEAIQ